MDYSFYAIKDSTSKSIFSCLFNLGNYQATYEFYDENGNNQRGGFLLNDSTDEEVANWDITWKNASSVIVNGIDIGDERSTRNFYINFKSINGNIFAELKAGKLSKKK